MQEAAQAGNVARKPRWGRALYAVAAVFFVLDVLLKRWVMTDGPAFGPDWLRFEAFLNEGIVFSLPVPAWLHLPIAVAVLLLFVAALVAALAKRHPTATALLFVVLGAVSNMVDRFTYLGTVDYLIFFGRSAVNLADVMIVAGVLLLIFAKRKQETSESNLATEPK
ncbi:signal peptidase II [Patescibacteria group bacterium]